MGTSRRGLFGLMTLAAGFAFRPQSAKADTETRKLDLSELKKGPGVSCLYHCDFGDPARFAQVLTNISNHYGAYDNDSEKVKIVIVTHSQGIKFFLSDLAGTPWEKETLDPAVYDRFVGLTKLGLEAYLCQITFKRLNVDPAKARSAPFLSFVPSGVATVADLQSKGFAYLKVG
jgi:intracellular sulfur oxidation DsrE/DsrF family protein